jgi:site-specific recombinase XerD
MKQDDMTLSTFTERHAAHRYEMKWWCSQFGAKRIETITPKMVAYGRDALLKKFKPGTVNRYLSALSATLTCASREHGLRADNPVASVTWCKEPKGIVRWLSKDELAALRKALRGDDPVTLDLRDAFILALATGSRKGELWPLRWEQVDIQRRIILLEDTKNGDRRSLTLAGEALETMQRRHAERIALLKLPVVGSQVRKDRYGGYTVSVVRANDGKFLMTSENVFCYRNKLEPAWTRARKKSGVDAFRWHDTRHTTASYMMMTGANLHEVATQLGHRNLETTRRYAHLSTEHMASVMERMGKGLFS